jgi:hypothetical protein
VDGCQVSVMMTNQAPDFEASLGFQEAFFQLSSHFSNTDASTSLFGLYKPAFVPLICLLFVLCTSILFSFLHKFPFSFQDLFFFPSQISFSFQAFLLTSPSQISFSFQKCLRMVMIPTGWARPTLLYERPSLPTLIKDRSEQSAIS